MNKKLSNFSEADVDYFQALRTRQRRWETIQDIHSFVLRECVWRHEEEYRSLVSELIELADL